IKAKAGWSALVGAAGKGDIDSVKVLIEASADLDMGDANKGTPLMHAAAQGEAETVQLLLDAGADISLEDIMGETAGDYAPKSGDVKTLDIFSGDSQEEETED
ncbi:MAG: ankyrin repeat domain-containing protein, partial [Holophagae bacterium]|nr:ankyrin repeat domain-containing protein [Holophagae bacterium]